NAARTAQQWINTRLTPAYTFTQGDTVLYTLTPATIAGLTDISAQDSQLTVAFNKDRATAFVNDTLATAVNTPPVPNATIVDPAGTVLRTVSSGTNGRTLTKTDALSTALTTALKNGKPTKLALTFTDAPFDTTQTVQEYAAPPAGSEHARWADVNLTGQTVTLMNGATPGQTFVLSSGATATPTPTGVFAVTSMPASRDVATCDAGDCHTFPGVRWVIWFDNHAAFLAASWRTDFGTPVTDGSLFLSTADAEALYKWLSVGNAVNIHN
ncbi:MAG: L,D-transpeptidase, partial [Propionibacteriaceae bacterium]|nr:L,D-transpeptidase [Propionibacteriaceae bacterium]